MTRPQAQLSKQVSKALRAFRKSERPNKREPRFYDLALALEREMRDPGISEAVVLECFGPPDILLPGLYVYYWDHEKAGGARDEWYFYLNNGKLTNSGYNARGINDFPAPEQPKTARH